MKLSELIAYLNQIVPDTQNPDPEVTFVVPRHEVQTAGPKEADFFVELDVKNIPISENKILSEDDACKPVIGDYTLMLEVTDFYK